MSSDVDAISLTVYQSKKNKGWVMEFNDICPSKWVDFCQYSPSESILARCMVIFFISAALSNFLNYEHEIAIDLEGGERQPIQT